MVDTGTKSGKGALACASAAIAVGASVLLWWTFGRGSLVPVSPGFMTMNPVTAAAFILAGTSLGLLLHFSDGAQRRSRALILTARWCASAVVLIALVRLAGILFASWDLQVDRCLFASKLAIGSGPGDRMAANTALCLLLVGGALILVKAKTRILRCGVECAALAAGFVSFLALLGYAYGAPPLYCLGPFGAMSMQTALTFCILAVGLLLSHTHGGLLAVFTEDNPNGKLARRLLATAVLIPALIGVLARWAEKAGYPVPFCDAAETMGNIVILAVLVCWSVRTKFRADVELRNVEEEVRDSEKRFAGAFEHAPIGVALISPGGRWLQVNRALCDLLGYSEAELLSRTIQELTHPDDVEASEEKVRRLDAGEMRSFQMRKRYVHRGGSVITALVNVSRVRNDRGQPSYAIVQIQDITERERAVADLEESKSFLHAALDALSAHIAILDENGVILEVNAAWDRFGDQTCFKVGRRVVGDNYLESCDLEAADSSEDAAALAEGIRAVIAGQSDEFQLEYPCQSEQVQNWFFMRVTRFGGGGPTRVVVARENVTQRKQTEIQVLLNEQRYRSLVEATAAIVWTTDGSGKFKVEQPDWTAFTGQRFEELRGWGWLKTIHPDDQTATAGAWSVAVANCSVFQVEHRVRTRNQSYRDMLVRAAPILAENGSILEWIGVHSDITERKQAETALRQSEERYRALIEWSPEPIAVQRDLKLLFVNTAAVKMLGATSARDLVGKSSIDLVHPDSREAVMERLKAHAANGGDPIPVSAEQFIKLDGTIIDVETQGTRIVYDGEPAVYLSLHDVTERKRAETELRWKTAFLEAQVNSSLDGTLVVDGNGKKLLQNQRFTDLLSIPRFIADDLSDEKQVAWVTGMTKDPAAFIEKVAHLYSHRDESSRDTIELTDGSVLDRYSAPVVGSDETYFGRIWTFRDVTERTQSEALLLESQQRLKLATESARIGIWDWDVVEDKLDWDTQMLALYGLRAGDFQGAVKAWQTLLHREDRERVEAELAAALAGVNDFATEFRIVWPNGEVHEIQASGLVKRAANGSPAHLIGVNWDITDRKRTESRYRRLVESNVQSILFWNLAGGITGANDAFLKLVGYNREDLEAGRINWMAMTPPEYRQVDQRALKDIATKGSSALYEKEFIRKDGTRAPILLGASAFEDNPEEGVCFVVDLTDRKRLETQLVQSQKLETVGKLAGGIAHEFNSILTTIIGQSELLLADLPPSSPLIPYGTEITKAAGRAAALTRQLLAYGRKQLLQPEALDLGRVVLRMEGVLRHLMGGEINTRIVAAPGLHAVKADVGQLEQVIMQMAINARDAMPNGGKFTLETGNVCFDQESFGSYSELKQGNHVMLSVSDTGVGMSAEVKARLFEPFFSTKGVGQGTGLGLSTCYGIIKQSGGHISVYSELAQGATFKIYLPQAEEPKIAPSRRPASTDLPRGTETILLVEEDPALRDMASALLRRLGYTVLAAANGIEALSLKQQHDTAYIDLLCTDSVMPHMSGKELADRIRALYPHAKVIFTSAYRENAIAAHEVANIGVSLLQKPFMPSTLANKVREVLDHAHSETARKP